MSFLDLSKGPIKGWLKEPLVHFLIGGLLIYFLFAWRGVEVDPASRSIDVSRKDQAQLSLSFERMMGRSPTDAELDRQIERFVRDEILYREALRLGLDGNDPVVRRRMSQKMDMLAAAQAETAQPSDATLKDWLSERKTRFTDDGRYTLDQVYKPEMSGAKAALQAANAANNDGADWHELGDPISLPKTLENQPRKEILDRFGEEFLREVEGLKASQDWQGPIASGFGWHIVRLRKHDAGKVRPLAEIREKVESDWRTSTIESRKEQAYAILRDAYTVEIGR